MAGARSQSNLYLIDGLSNLDTGINTPLDNFRITDAGREFAVQTSVPLPEFGRGAGAQVNIVTKSGGHYGPNVQNYDFALAKSFPLVAKLEGTRLQFRADFFNLFNHTNFANPVRDRSDADFGKIAQTVGTAVQSGAVATTAGPLGGPRLVQLSLRLQF